MRLLAAPALAPAASRWSIAALERGYRRLRPRAARGARAPGLERTGGGSPSQPVRRRLRRARVGRAGHLLRQATTGPHTPASSAGVPAAARLTRRVARDGRAVCAVTEAMVERGRHRRGPGALIANGVDAGRVARAGSAAAWFGHLPGPRLLYAGTLDSRIDVEALRRDGPGTGPKGRSCSSGPSPSPRHLAAAAGQANVVIPRRCPRSRSPPWCHAADVCLRAAPRARR